MLGKAISPESISPTLNALTHRGPDGKGVFHKAHVCFGHRRLTIIDLSDNSNQPMLSAQNDCVVTFNGEIYNYLEIRNELIQRGYIFRSAGDTEVLLQAYKEWGEDLFAHLNGMYSFALYDFNADKLLLAVDPAGQKPLFYFCNRKRIIFASELSALLKHSAICRKLNLDGIASYLVHDYCPAPNTVISGVKRFEPGMAMTFDAKSGNVRKWKHWNISDCMPPHHVSPSSESEALEQFEEVMSKSVMRHLRSDVPIGIYLSAGLDSTTIATLACDTIGAENINTFTIRIDNPSYNEADQAENTAKMLGTKHHELSVTSDDGLLRTLQVLDKLDEPLADLGLLSVHQVSAFAKEHVKVVLSGDGGDEFFYGYEPMLKWRLSKLVDSAPQFLVTGLEKLIHSYMPGQYGYMGALYKAEVFLRGYRQPEAIRNLFWVGGYSATETMNILRDGKSIVNLQTDHMSTGSIYQSVLNAHARTKDWTELDRLGHEFQTTYLPFCICSHSDKASMMVSLEARSPFLDANVMRFASSLSHHYKIRNGKGKWIMRKYLANRLKKSPIPKLKKRGYTMPIAQWIKTPGIFQDYVVDLLSENSIRDTGIFHPNQVSALLNQHLKGESNNYKKLWPIVVLQSWLKKEQITS